MPNQPRPGTVRIGLTLDAALMDRARKQAERLAAETGLKVEAADVIRATLAKHLDPLEPEKPKRKRGA